MNLDQYANLLSQACERLGFSNVSPDATGFCTLDFGGAFLNCAASANGQMIRVTSAVAQISGECPRSVLERLLEAQLFFKDTRGTSFSYDKEKGTILLHLNLLLGGLDAVMLETALRNCAEVSAEFSKEIADLLKDDTKTERTMNEASGYQMSPYDIRV